MIEAKKVDTTMQRFEQENDKDVEFRSRYFLEEAYFSATDQSNLYLFDEDGKLLEEIELNKINEERLETLAQDKYEHYSFAYALVDKKPTYVIVSDKEDVFIDLETFEEILVFRKGIAND